MAETSPPPQGREGRRFPVIPLLLVLLVALFLFPYVFLGRSLLPLDLIPVFQPWVRHARELWGSLPPAHNPLLDALQQYYPRRVHMQEALQGGWLPLWEPHVYGGSPFVGAQQGAVLYPPTWLLALFPPALQFGWSALLHLSAAAVGGFLFLRLLGLGRAAAATGAVAFTFNGFIIVWLAYPNVTQWTLCWLPLALYCWERGHQDRDVRWLSASGLVLGLNLLGGHAQSSAYVFLTWGAWVLVRALAGPRPLPTLFRGLGLPLLLAGGLALGHLLPALDFVPRTDRAGRIPWEAVQGTSMPPAQFWTLLLPRLFGDGTAQFAQQSWLPLDGHAGLAFVERTFYPGVSVLVLAVGGLVLLRRGQLTAETQRTAEGRRGESRRQKAEGSGQGGTTPEHLNAERLNTRTPEHPNTRTPEHLNTRTPEHPPSPTLPYSHTSLLPLLARFSLVLTVLAVLWAMGTPLYKLLWWLPVFGQFTAMARILCVAAWPLACLAALGVHAVLGAREAGEETPATGQPAVKGMAIAAVVLGAIAAVGHFIFGGAAPEGVQQFLAAQGRASVDSLATRDLLLALLWMAAPVLLLGLFAFSRRSPLKPALVGGLVALVVTADLFAFGGTFNPATDPALAHVVTPEIRALQEAPEAYRFLSVGPDGQRGSFNQWMPSNLPATFGLPDIAGSDSFVTRRYRQWETAMTQAAGGAGPWARPGMGGLEAVGVRYYLTGARELFPGNKPFVGTAVQEDPGALPYARLHTNVQALPTQDAVLENLSHPDRFVRIALTSGPNAPAYEGPPTVTPFQVRRVNSNRLVLEGTAPQPGLLVVAEQFDPAWRARVDGRPERVVPADHLLMGIPLEAGQHRVELVYAPAPFRVGLFFTLLTLGAVTTLLIAARRRP